MKQWHLLNICYNNTHKFIREMAKRCIPAGCSLYIPSTFEQETYHKSEIKKRSLFEYYIFILCDFEKQSKIIVNNFRKNSVESYFLLDQSGRGAVIQQKTIDALRQSELKYRANQFKPKYAIGEVVMAVSSPLKGLVGNVSQITEKYVYICVTTTKGKILNIPLLEQDIMSLQE